MKLIRTTSILAGLLLAVASVSTTTACKKKEDDKNKKTTKPGKTDTKKKPDPKAQGKKAVTKEAAKKPAATDSKTPPPAAGDGYEVKITRPLKVGYKYKFTSTGKRDMKIMANGKPAPGSGVMSWDYEAEVTVKAINDKGQATAEDHKVVKLEVTANGNKMTPLAKDKVVVATLKGEEETFTVDGKPAEKQVAGVMGEIVSLDDGKDDDDEMFGAKGKKKAGDSWDLNKAAMVKSWAAKAKDAPMPLKIENLSGKVTLVGPADVDGIKAVKFKVSVTMDKFAPKMGPIQPSAGSIKLEMNAWLPADTASVAGRGDTKKMTMHVEGTAGPAKVVIDMVQEGTEKKIAIK